MKNKISIIIPVYNRENSIVDCLDSLLKQKIKVKYDIVVINDGSTDKTLSVIESFKKKYPSIFKIISYRGNKGAYYARNKAIKTSSGGILVFTDSDCIADENWLFIITRNIITKKEFACMGFSNGITIDPWQKVIQEAYETYLKRIAKNGYATTLDTRNCAISKKLIKKIGLFNTYFKRSGDAEFGLRMIHSGYKIKYVAKAIVTHKHRLSIWKQAKIIYEHGKMSVVLKRMYKNPLRRFQIIRLTSIFLAILFIIALPFVIFAKATFIKLLYLLICFLVFISLIIRYFKSPYTLIIHRIIYNVVSTIAWSSGFIISYTSNYNENKQKT